MGLERYEVKLMTAFLFWGYIWGSLLTMSTKNSCRGLKLRKAGY